MVPSRVISFSPPSYAKGKNQQACDVPEPAVSHCLHLSSWKICRSEVAHGAVVEETMRITGNRGIGSGIHGRNMCMGCTKAVARVQGIETRVLLVEGISTVTLQ